MLVSCGGEKQPDETTGQSGDQGEQTEDKWADVNFNGDTLYVSLSEWRPSFVTSADAPNSINFMKGPDNYTTDAVQNAVYDRNLTVKEKLGLDVQYIPTQYSGAADYTLTVIENFVLADLEDSPDIISTMSYGMVRAGIRGILYNALTQDYTNYFDFTHENWYSDFMYDNTLDASKIFMLAGDYFIDVLRYSYGMLVNMDMYDEVFAKEGGVEALFELVQSGDWTYDEMMRCSALAYVDEGTIGVEDDADTFGIVHNGWWFARTAFSTSGLTLFDRTDDNKIKYTEDITDVHTFVDKLINVSAQSSFRLNWTGNSQAYDSTLAFVDGKALFALDSPVLNLEGTQLQNMDEKVCVIPYPKYNKDIEYAALVSDNANVGGIPYNSDKFTEASAFLQMSTELSNGGKGTLIYEYYDVTLKYKLSATPAQVAMLEFIRNGVCCPTSMLYDNYFAQNVGAQSYFLLINKCLGSGTNTFASDWASQYNAVQGSLESVLATYGQQD
jgi:hypothetical protein